MATMKLDTTGLRLKTQRARRRLTLVQLAALTDIDKSQLSRLERDERQPHLGHIQALAKALRCSPQDLVPRRAAP